MYSLNKNSKARLPLALGLVAALTLGACSSGHKNYYETSNDSLPAALQSQPSSSKTVKTKKETDKNLTLYRYRNKYPSIFRGKSNLPPLDFTNLDTKYNAYPFISGNPDPRSSDVSSYKTKKEIQKDFKYQLQPEINFEGVYSKTSYPFNPLYTFEDKVSIPNGNYIDQDTLDKFYKRLFKNIKSIVIYQMNVERLENLCWFNAYLFNARREKFSFDSGVAQGHMLDAHNQPSIFNDIGLSEKITESAFGRTLYSTNGDMGEIGLPIVIRTNDLRGMRVVDVLDDLFRLSTPNRQFRLKLYTTKGNNTKYIDLSKPLEFFLKRTFITGLGTENVTCNMIGVFNQKEYSSPEF